MGLSIGEAEAASGLPAKTIRYYEDIGLVKPAREGNGYRSFSADDVARLRLLKRARLVGFSVDDCRDLLAMGSDGLPSGAEPDLQQLVTLYVSRLDRRLAELHGLRAQINTWLVNGTEGPRPLRPHSTDLPFACD